jgi:hypothetical protein
LAKPLASAEALPAFEKAADFFPSPREDQRRRGAPLLHGSVFRHKARNALKYLRLSNAEAKELAVIIAGQSKPPKESSSSVLSTPEADSAK